MSTSETRRVRLNYARPALVKQLLSPAFAPCVRAEQPNPRDPNDQGNVLLVTAAPVLVDRIVADIKQIDRYCQHVLLEVRVVSMEKGSRSNLGVSWNWPKTSPSGSMSRDGTNPTGITSDSPYGVQIGCTPDQTGTNSLMTALNRLKENRQADILADLRLVCSDGRQTDLRVIEEQWRLMMSPPHDTYYMEERLQKIEPGTVMTVTPYIGDNNDITLQMAVEVRDSIPKARGGNLPLVTRRTAKQAVTIKDGGTVVVAGVTVDGLKPKDTPGRELVIFVTAHLVPEPRETRRMPPSDAPSTQVPSVGIGPIQASVLRDESRRTDRVIETTDRRSS